jgi:hypothetical protein
MLPMPKTTSDPDAAVLFVYKTTEVEMCLVTHHQFLVGIWFLCQDKELICKV